MHSLIIRCFSCAAAGQSPHPTIKEAGQGKHGRNEILIKLFQEEINPVACQTTTYLCIHKFKVHEH